MSIPLTYDVVSDTRSPARIYRYTLCQGMMTTFIGGIIQNAICSQPAFLIHRSVGEILHRRLYVLRIFLAAYKNAVMTGYYNHIL